MGKPFNAKKDCNMSKLKNMWLVLPKHVKKLSNDAIRKTPHFLSRRSFPRSQRRNQSEPGHLAWKGGVQFKVAVLALNPRPQKRIPKP